MSKLDDLKNEVAELEAQEASAQTKAEDGSIQETQTLLNRAERVAIIRDEAKPLADRIAAASIVKKLDPYYLYQFSDEDVIERLMPHPHLSKLAELKAFIEDRASVSDVEVYINGRIAAIVEFRSLMAQSPKRHLDAPVLVNPEQSVAYHAAMQDAKHGVSRDTYSYALRRLGWKV